jgi:adenosine deaminase
MKRFIHELPKAELHIHIEGSLEPELMFKIAQRNDIPLPYDSIKDIRKAYDFTDSQAFWKIYYQGLCVLRHEADFYDLTWAYLKKAHVQNIRHTEIFFDPLAHTNREIPFKTIIQGMQRALQEAQQQFNLSSKLIMIFPRHISAEIAMDLLVQALPFKDWIIGVGLDLSPESGHPLKKFTDVFKKARDKGFFTVAHCANTDDIWQALQYLNVSRIDHGIRCIDDSELVTKLKEAQTPLTVCPLSNVKMGVFKTINDHNIKHLFDSGLCVTINSDDPSYCGGYLSDNFLAIQKAFHFSHNNLYQLVKNSFQASFLNQAEKQTLLKELENHYQRSLG